MKSSETPYSVAFPYNVFFQSGQQEFFSIVFCSTRYQTLISDIDTFTLFDRPEFLSNQSFVYESRRSLARHEYFQGGQQQFFIVVFFSICYRTLISDNDTFLLALFIVSLDLKS